MNNLSNYFDNIVKSNRLMHSYLIGNVTFDEIKDELFNVINKYIFGDDRDIDNNPDLIVLRPEKGNVKKEEIKELIKEISTTSQFNNNKVYVIEGTEKLNDFACNAILKTLEEPKDNIYAFLLSENVESVKPTIISRWQKVFVSSEVKEKSFDDNIVNLGNTLIDYIEKENILTIAHHPELYNELEDRNILKEVLEYILDVYFNTLNNYNSNIQNIIKTNNSIEKISKKVLVINDNICNLDYYLNKNLTIDRFIIEMWRC